MMWNHRKRGNIDCPIFLDYFYASIADMPQLFSGAVNGSRAREIALMLPME
jgi:hypothetical protein